jgi:hypothetical protein
VDSPARLAARHPAEVQAHLAVVAAVVVAAAVAVVAVAVAAEAQASLCHRHAVRCVLQTRQSAVGHMSHKSSRTRATDPHDKSNVKITYPLLIVPVSIVGCSTERPKLRNRSLLSQLSERSVWTVLRLRGRWCSCTSMEVRALCIWLPIER